MPDAEDFDGLLVDAEEQHTVVAEAQAELCGRRLDLIASPAPVSR